jgi:hypothetical protein
MARHSIRVIEVREEFLGEVFYVAQALEADVKGIGTTVQEARASFARNLHRLIDDAPPGKDPLAGLSPAGQRFWDIYQSYIDHGGAPGRKYW